MKIYCECCGRQILPGRGKGDKYVTYGIAAKLVEGYCCKDCGKGLDENGLWPEERYEWEKWGI